MSAQASTASATRRLNPARAKAASSRVLIGGDASIGAEPAAAGKGAGGGEVGIGRTCAQCRERFGGERAGNSLWLPVARGSWPTTRRDDGATQPGLRHRPRRRADPIANSARQALRSAALLAARPRSYRANGGGGGATAPVANSRPNWHSAPDRQGPNFREAPRRFRLPSTFVAPPDQRSAMVPA